MIKPVHLVKSGPRSTVTHFYSKRKNTLRVKTDKYVEIFFNFPNGVAFLTGINMEEVHSPSFQSWVSLLPFLNLCLLCELESMATTDIQAKMSRVLIECYP